MQTTSAKLYSLDYTHPQSYLAAMLFIAGNIALPQLCHAVHLGGPTWLPIYFFTLIGAYKYGWRVGLMTALISPVINSLFFGMPPSTALPEILLKSALLALAAGWIASHYRKASLLLLTATVLAYQIPGTLGEWIIDGDLYHATKDFRIGLPGMAVQIFGGYIFINYVLRK